MAYIGDFSIFEQTREEENEHALVEHSINPGAFMLAPVTNPGTYARGLFANGKCGMSLGSPLSWHMPAPGKDESSAVMAMAKGTTTLAFIYKGGIVVAVDSRASMGTYISSQTVMKILEISDVILGTMAGGAADCAYWERYLAKICRLYELRNQEKISIAAASNILANIFYGWRGYGLCCGTMIAGWNDHEEKPELYYVDDKATRLKGNLFSCGSGSTFAYGILDNCYKWDMCDEEAIELGQRAIYHATHRDGASGGVCRVYHCYRGGWKPIVEGSDVNELHYAYAAERGSDGANL